MHYGYGCFPAFLIPETEIVFLGAGTLSAVIDLRTQQVLDEKSIYMFWAFEWRRDSALIFNGDLWHSGTQNEAGAPRRMMQCQFIAREFFRPAEAGPKISERFTPSARYLFGPLRRWPSFQTPLDHSSFVGSGGRERGIRREPGNERIGGQVRVIGPALQAAGDVRRSGGVAGALFHDRFSHLEEQGILLPKSVTSRT
jgi:hypothetical protein